MAKHTQIIRRLLPTNCLSVFEHFVGLALKGLRNKNLFEVAVNEVSVEVICVELFKIKNKHTILLVADIFYALT